MLNSRPLIGIVTTITRMKGRVLCRLIYMVYSMGADADVVIDERPWKPPGAGIEIGEANVDVCVGWMTRKVLEHAGFQGEWYLQWYRRS